MGMAEWTLEEAAADLRIAHGKLKTLPRRMRSGRRRGKRPPPLVTFLSPGNCVTMEEHPKWLSADEHCGPCREPCIVPPCGGHVGYPLASNVNPSGPVAYPVVPTTQIPTAAAAPALELPQAVLVPQNPVFAGSFPTKLMQASPVLPSPSRFQSPCVRFLLPDAGATSISPPAAAASQRAAMSAVLPGGGCVVPDARSGGAVQLIHSPTYRAARTPTGIATHFN